VEENLKTQKLSLPIWISSLCRRRTDPRPWATCTEKLVKIAPVVPDTLADRQTDRQTHRRYSSQYFATAAPSEITVIGANVTACRRNCLKRNAAIVSTASYLQLLLPPPRRICNRRCLFVCLSVSNFAQKLGICMKFSGKVGNGPLAK